MAMESIQPHRPAGATLHPWLSETSKARRFFDLRLLLGLRGGCGSFGCLFFSINVRCATAAFRDGF